MTSTQYIPVNGPSRVSRPALHYHIRTCISSFVYLQQYQATEFALPADVRKVATPRTLRVFHGGLSKKWKLIKHGIMLLIGPWFRLGSRFLLHDIVVGLRVYISIFYV